MNREEKIKLLRHLFHEVSNLGVLTWGPVPGGYRWNCQDHATAVRLADFLLSNLDVLEMDRDTFPYHYEPALGPNLIFEPIGDPQ